MLLAGSSTVYRHSTVQTGFTPKPDLQNVRGCDPHDGSTSPSTTMQGGDEDNGIIVLNDGVQHSTAIRTLWCHTSCYTTEAISTQLAKQRFLDMEG